MIRSSTHSSPNQSYNYHRRSVHVHPLIRPYSKKSSLTFLPHKFSREEAAHLFFQREKKRWFAPLPEEFPKVDPKSVVILKDDPLKKIFIPIFKVEAHVQQTNYSARYGIDWYQTITVGKNTTVVVHTNWFPISGQLGRKSYFNYDEDMTIYGAFSWDSKMVEDAYQGIPLPESLKKFDEKLVGPDILIDPFLKRQGLANEVAFTRIKSWEKSRIYNDVKHRVTCDHIDIKKVEIQYGSFNTTSHMLPGYILQYSNNPPIIMSAINENPHVVGGGLLSPIKLGSIAFAITGIASIFFPPLRAAIIIAGAIGATIGFKGREWQYRFQERSLDHEFKENEAVAETKKDRKRRLKTDTGSENIEELPQPNEAAIGEKLDVDPKYFEIIGLNPNDLMTKEKIQRAFKTQILLAHPDHEGGSVEKTRDVLQARDMLLGSLRKTHSKGPAGRRTYSTLAKVKTMIPPSSKCDPRVSELIRTVIEEKNYIKARKLVEKDLIHPDAHDDGENTLLTEAAKRGDLAATRFALEELEVSPDTSCDCPEHRTALHYAAQKGHTEIVKLLLNKGANSNLINSRGETALDLAANKAITEALKSSGGINYRNVEGSEGFLRSLRGMIGYGSEERTLASGGERIQRKALSSRKVTKH